MATATPKTKVVKERKPPRKFNFDGSDIFTLTKEEIAAASKFTRHQAKSMVGFYYSMQKVRQRRDNQQTAAKLGRSTAKEKFIKDIPLMDTMVEEVMRIETQIRRLLTAYVKSTPIGNWMVANSGVGEMTAAVILSCVDLDHCCCKQYYGEKEDAIPEHNCPGVVAAGSIWKLAGLDGGVSKKLWVKGTKRPWNALLKRQCWIFGESCKKLGSPNAIKDMNDNQLKEWIIEQERKKAEYNKEEYIPFTEAELAKKLEDTKRNREVAAKRSSSGDAGTYVRLWRQRKNHEERMNETGGFKEQAKYLLEESRKRRANITAGQLEAWEAGKLQPCGLDTRADMWVAKIFLSHFLEVSLGLLGREMRTPFAIGQLKHSEASYIPPPFWDRKNKKLVGVDGF